MLESINGNGILFSKNVVYKPMNRFDISIESEFFDIG